MTVYSSVTWREAPAHCAEHQAYFHMMSDLASRLGVDVGQFQAMPIPEILIHHARRDPSGIAVVGLLQRLSWTALIDAFQQLGRVISTKVPLGRSVAVLLPDGPDALVAVLACMAAGRMAVILNASHPIGRNIDILSRAGVAAVICHELPAALSGAGDFVAIHPEERSQTAPPAIPLQLHDPAVVLFTSGSTGRPKGIVLTQEMSVYRSTTYLLAPDLSAPNRTLNLFSLAAVTGLHGVIGTLISGGCVVMPETASPLDVMLSERPSRLIALPALLRTLALSRYLTQAFSNLALLSVTGDSSTGSDVAAWHAVLPETARLQAVYGQTECTISQWFVPRGFAEPGALALGFPRPGIEYAVLDEQGQAVADGEAGMLHIRSGFAALGEWADGGFTPGRLVLDSTEPGKRIVNAGDVVKQRPDGMLAFAGRADRQLKIRGLRIEPIEVEAAIRQIPGISDVAVIAVPSQREPELVAFVVGVAEGNAAAVMDAVKARLPAPMWPRRIVTLTSLPRLPGGKVDLVSLLDAQKKIG